MVRTVRYWTWLSLGRHVALVLPGSSAAPPSAGSRGPSVYGTGFGVWRGSARAPEGGLWSRRLLQSHVFFFFSSRRRHTRFDCDWSSDVCSSDLHHYRDVMTRETLYGGQPALQEFIPGTAYSIGGLFYAGQALRACAHRKILTYPAAGDRKSVV